MVEPLEGQSAEEILRSALAQVVSLECRLEQLLSERDAARGEALRERKDLESALGRVADLEARLQRAEAERSEAEHRADDASRAPPARALTEALERARRLAERQERWFAKAVEWQRIADAGHAADGPDLGGFIAELRQEVLAGDAPRSAAIVPPPMAPAPAFTVSVRRVPLPSAIEREPVAAGREQQSAREQSSTDALDAIATRMHAEGRLSPQADDEGGPITPAESALRRLTTAGLRSPEPQQRVDAARRVAFLRPAGSAHAVIAALSHEQDPLVRVALFGALAAVGSESARPMCAAAVMDPDPHVRRAALSALARLGGRPPDGALSDTDPAVRRRAAVALGLLGEAGSRGALSDLAQRDPDARVRRAAAASLGALALPPEIAPRGT